MTKNQKAVAEKFDSHKLYQLAEACQVVKDITYTKFDATVELSANLGVVNLLPIPALDGGHVLFLLYEMITGRKPTEQFMIRAEYVGFGILILLMVVANLNDILRWLGYM